MSEPFRATRSDLPFRLRFLAVLVLPAAALMAMEIVSSRLLSPTFGNSVYVWGAIISVFLAAMSVGYVAGGRLADRDPSLTALGRLMLLATLMIGFALLWGRQLVAAIGGLAHGRPSGALWACAVVYGPAILFLSTVAPFAVRLAGSQSGRLGGIAGGLYALSTAGSLVGTLVATFVLIPRLDLDAIMGVLLSATALSAIAGLWGGRGWAARGLVATSCLLLIWPWWRGADQRLGPLVLVERITPYQTLRVLEQEGVRTLQSDGALHGAVDVTTGQPSRQRPNYWSVLAAAWLLTPEARRVAVLGLGAGEGARYLEARFPQASIEVVEIDPAMLEVAQKYFFLRTSPRLSVVLDDARRFLDDRPGPWDVIVADTYIGQSIPFHLATTEFFALVSRRLAPGGVLVVNVATSPDRPFARALLRTLRAHFGHVLALRAGFNHLLFAYDGVRPESTLLATAERLDRELGGTPPFRSYFGQRVTIDGDLTDVPELRDDYAPVDALLDLGSVADVESLHR
jgi:spermidine synthase